MERLRSVFTAAALILFSFEPTLAQWSESLFANTPIQSTTGLHFNSVSLASPGTLPSVTTTAATSVSSSSATLNGTINPNGDSTSSWFEWGTSSTLSTYSSTIPQNLGAGTSAIAVSGSLTGLAAGTTYYFRAAAQNVSGTQRGSVLSFTTGGVQPAVFTLTTSSVTSGNIGIGCPKVSLDTIRNTGGSTLTISSIVSSSPRYEVSPTNASIAPGGSQTIALTFTPLTKSTIDADIVFTHNGTTSSDTASATGTGANMLRTWSGASDSLWYTGGNWPCATVPIDGDTVVLPSELRAVISHNSSPISLGALSVSTVAELRIADSVSGFNVDGNVSIGGTFGVADSLTTHLSVGGDWLETPNPTLGDYGFVPGHSRVKFRGTGRLRGSFYDLTVDSGSAMSSAGNIKVSGDCLLSADLALRSIDTVIIASGGAGSLQGAGDITEGTITRNISAGDTSSYRFESPDTYIQFDGTGTYPASVSMTTQPDTIPPSFNLPWKAVSSTVDTVTNTVKADSIGQFSRWAIGVIRPNASTIADPIVRRDYVITTDSGSGYRASLQLRYDQSEVTSTVEPQLKLLRGPCFIDTVYANWNMVSLPVVPEEHAIRNLFPAASSEAFTYSGAYQTTSRLEFGRGYWLKFPSTQTVSILGDDREQDTISVDAGWNLIGSLTFPVNAVDVASIPGGIITSRFFGYRNSYYVAQNLKPLSSYWVKSNSTGTIVLRASGFGGLSRLTAPAVNDALDAFDRLTFRDAEGNVQELYFGSSSKIDLREFEMPPVPPARGFDVRYATGRILALADERESKDIPILISSHEYPISVTWALESRDSRASLLIDGKEMAVSCNEVTQIADPAAHVELRLQAGKSDLPTEFLLEQNYPNPFNSATVIHYQLPAGAGQDAVPTYRVKLNIYNMLGQLVKTLVDDIEDSGYKSVEWNASEVSSGIYLYRVDATNDFDVRQSFVRVKKAVVTR